MIIIKKSNIRAGVIYLRTVYYWLISVFIACIVPVMFSVTSLKAASWGDIVITEVIADVKGGETTYGDCNEFIEIYNRTGDSIDVSNWIISDGQDSNDTISAWDMGADGILTDVDVTTNTTVIPSGSYAVILDSEYVLGHPPEVDPGNQPYDFPADTVILKVGQDTTLGNGLSDADMPAIYLEDSIGVMISSWSLCSDTAQADGASVEMADYSLHNEAGNWAECSDDTHNGGGSLEYSTPGGQNSNYTGGEYVPDNTAPAAISNLTAITGDTEGTVKLSWTAPGDDGTGGNNAAEYVVKYATSQITGTNFYDSFVSTFSPGSEWIPVNFAEEETNRIVSGLISGTSYYFAVKAVDEEANWASWSTIAVNQLNYAMAAEAVADSSPTWAVIDCFENDHDQADETSIPDAAWWTSDSDVYTYPVVSTMSFNGTYSLEINYDKSGGGGKPWAVMYAGDLDNGSNNISDFTLSISSSVSLQAYPVDKDVDILMKLRDINANESNNIQTLNAGTTNQWQKMDWTWDAASLGTCDPSRIKEVLLFFAPGDNAEIGTVYIDDLKLENINSNVVNFTAEASTETVSVALSWPAAGDDGGNMKEYHIYRSSNSFSDTQDDGVTLIKTTTTLNYTDNSALQLDTTYYYSLTAEDENGNLSVMTVNASTKTVDGSIVMNIGKSTSTAYAKPGEEITYTITYENTGTAPASNFCITQAVPFNTYISEDVALGSADEKEYYIGTDWSESYNDQATKIRWKDNNVSASSGQLSVSYKLKVK